MAIGDITFLDGAVMSNQGALRFLADASATLINPGEPASVTLGADQEAIAAVTSTPVVGTDYYAGIAATTSTNTGSAEGEVYCYPIDPSIIFLIAPKTAATWATQALYDALVGSRVTLDLTAGVYTINASDSANNGCVVRPLDVSKYPGKVAFSFRAGVNFMS